MVGEEEQDGVRAQPEPRDRSRRDWQLDPIVETLARALRSFVVVIFHTALAATIVTGITAFECYLRWLAQGGEILIFDRFPLRYLFQAIDVGVILAYGYQGIREAWKAFGGH